MLTINYPLKYITGEFDLEISIGKITSYIPSNYGLFESGAITDKGGVSMYPQSKKLMNKYRIRQPEKVYNKRRNK
ncbi:MAG: hypothetical protein ACP5D6_06360 [Kosmotogaceae bacterium]